MRTPNDSTKAHVKTSRTFALALLLVLFLNGCETPRGQDGSVADALVLTPFVVAGAPVAVLFKGWEIIGDGTKKHVYAAPGLTEQQVRDAVGIIDEERIYHRITGDSDGTTVWKIKTRTMIFYARFKDGVTVKYRT